MSAEGYVLGLGAEGDSADGHAISAFGDFGVGEKTWLSADPSQTAETQGIIRDNDTDSRGGRHWTILSVSQASVSAAATGATPTSSIRGI